MLPLLYVGEHLLPYFVAVLHVVFICKLDVEFRMAKTGLVGGIQRAAMIYSLFATCRLHKINPYNWLKDVLERMHLYTTSNIHELLPQNWKKPEA